MMTGIAALFAKQALLGLAGRLWKGFCDFIATPVGAAVVAGLIMFTVGVAHEHRSLNAKWQAKWTAAEKQAEQARVKRDADIQAKIQADAAERLAALTKRKDELEQQVKTYEAQQLLQAASGKSACPAELTDDDDARWLSDAQRKRANVKPQARRGFALRLRGFSR